VIRIHENIQLAKPLRANLPGREFRGHGLLAYTDLVFVLVVYQRAGHEDAYHRLPARAQSRHLLASQNCFARGATKIAGTDVSSDQALRHSPRIRGLASACFDDVERAARLDDSRELESCQFNQFLKLRLGSFPPPRSDR
jgi:hypothetical protein